MTSSLKTQEQVSVASDSIWPSYGNRLNDDSAIFSQTQLRKCPSISSLYREITLKCSKSSSSLSCSQKRRMFRAFNTTPSTWRRATLSWTLCPWGSL